ncbi:serine hydrolase [Deinococcus cavernae]|uniref:serine hydrolase n=1 Tax=Deinococcus cavernae TaxID=2320857 RepID=UPI00308387D8
MAQVDPVTLNVIRAVGTNPDSEFPLASTYKQAVLWALLKKFDQGEVSPTERFDVTRSNQSLGAYPFDGTTIRDLSTRMIRDSDNTATDIIHRRVGLQSVQDIADHLGLCRSRLIMPTRNWWVMEAACRTPSTEPAGGSRPPARNAPGWPPSSTRTPASTVPTLFSANWTATSTTAISPQTT